MDRETLSNYGWIVICVLILAVMMALASPFGLFVSDAVKSTTQGLFDVNSSALNAAGIDVDNLNFDNSSSSSTTEVSDTVPEGGTYYVGVTSNKIGDYTGATRIYNAGEKLPDGYEPQIGDTYIDNDYEYKYNYYHTYLGWGYGWASDENQNGWGVRVLDISKPSYGPIFESIANKDIKSMQCTFEDCASLITSPSIPKGVTTLRNAFSDCASLTTMPIIPNKVTNMSWTFWGCEALKTSSAIPNGVTEMESTFTNCFSLTTAPTIPNSVINFNGTFLNCTSLTGTIEINANLTNDIACYLSSFNNVDFSKQNITLTGTTTILDLIGTTGINYCSTCNGMCSGFH